MTDRSDIHLTATLLESRLRHCHDLRLHIVLTSFAERQIQLCTLPLPYAAVVLRFETIDGTFIGGGPPPLPPPDEGPKSRVILDPGETYLRVYHGSDYFVNEVPPGRYRVKFRYLHTDADRGDWTGELTSEWLPFEVLAP